MGIDFRFASRNKEHDDRSYGKKLWYEDYQYQWW